MRRLVHSHIYSYICIHTVCTTSICCLCIIYVKIRTLVMYIGRHFAEVDAVKLLKKVHTKYPLI